MYCNSLLAFKKTSKVIRKPTSVLENEEYFTKSNLQKPRKSTKVVNYLRSETKKKAVKDYTKLSESNNLVDEVRQSPNSRATTATSKQHAYVYGERMFMSKYSNKPKFLKTLNSTLSPRK